MYEILALKKVHKEITLTIIAQYIKIVVKLCAQF